MAYTLTNLRKYVRVEIDDVAATRKMSTYTLTHDGGNGAAFFQDQSFNFVTEGIIVGDVIYNTTDGGSLAVIRAIGNGGATNDKLSVDSIDGGTDNDYDNGDVVQIWDRYAQKAFDGTRFTDTDIDDAITQAHSIVATRFGGVEASTYHYDIDACSKIDLVNISGTFSAGETITGGTNNHTAVVEYVGDNFLIVREHKAQIAVDGKTGTLVVGETVTGGTNSYTARVEAVNANDISVSDWTGTFADNEVLTGGTSGATYTVNEASGYNGGLIAANEAISGGTSSATANVKAAYTKGNFFCVADVPSNLKNIVSVRYWDGSTWQYLYLGYMNEWMEWTKSTSGNPLGIARWQDKLYIWPTNTVRKMEGLHIVYYKWPTIPSAATSSTDFQKYFDRVLVLESALILSRSMEDNDRTQGIMTEIARMNNDVFNREDDDTDQVRDAMWWDFRQNNDEPWW